MTYPTGEQLYEELCAAAAAAGARVDVFAAPLFGSGYVTWKLEQLRIARRPLRRTVDRVRSLIAGVTIAPVSCRRGEYAREYQQLTRAQADALGLPPSGRAIRDAKHIELQQRMRHRTELLRELTEQAHQDRRPGQTVADRVHELRVELGA